MAISALFKEIKNALEGYQDKHYMAYVKEQSQQYTTRMHYTHRWCEESMNSNFIKAFNKHKLVLTPTQKADLKKVIGSTVRSFNIVSNWQMYLDPYFIIATQKDILEGDAGGKVFVRPHHGVELVFYKNFTMGQATYTGSTFIPDNHLRAQTKFMDDLADTIIGNLRTASTFSVADRNVALSQDTKGNPTFLPNKSSGDTRLHAGDAHRGYNDDTQYGSDTTVRLVNFLEDMGNKSFSSIMTPDSTTGYKEKDVKFIAKEINREFNAGYTIDGFSKIDLFNDNVAEKDIRIKIVFGSKDKNALANKADKGDYKVKRKDPRLDNWFANLERDLMTAYAKDASKMASLSIAEMARRGVFAKVAKGLKTGSGMPDMRFKINKQLAKDARYKDKQKSKNGLSLVKNKSKTVKVNLGRVKKTRGIRDTGRATLNASPNPLALESLLNELLPKVVASKMTSPALVYRTGRFAESAEATEVMMGPRGGVNINYTYQKDPYQTFEPGFARGSTYRDPRKIIGESVREIAQSIMKDKFIRVRRV